MKTERNITAAELAERNGIRIGTLEKRFRKCFPSERWSRNAELTPEQAERLLSVSGTERKSGTQKARPVTRNLAAHTERPVLLSVPERAEPIAASAEPEPDAATQDRRVLLCRWLLWSITACQVFLVFVGCIFRFGGMVGAFVAFIPSAFLISANLVAGDARFFSSTETAKLSAFGLSAVFGYLHFLTFCDVVSMPDAGSTFWFSVTAATVVEVVAFSAIVLQQKISVEK